MGTSPRSSGVRNEDPHQHRQGRDVFEQSIEHDDEQQDDHACCEAESDV